MYTIYKLTVPNGKSYIGQTSLEVNRRWQGGLGYKENEELFKDIIEYGWRNLEKEILEEVEDKDEAHLKEREYILKFKTNEHEHGYNKHINDSTVGVIKTYYQRKKGLVRCIETEEIFNSVSAAARQYGVTHSSIDQAIKNGTPCRGKHWERMAVT